MATRPASVSDVYDAQIAIRIDSATSGVWCVPDMFMLGTGASLECHHAGEKSRRNVLMLRQIDTRSGRSRPVGRTIAGAPRHVRAPRSDVSD